MFYFNQLLHNLSNQVFKNHILVRLNFVVSICMFKQIPFKNLVI
jgi:hypothetical protein